MLPEKKNANIVEKFLKTFDKNEIAAYNINVTKNQRQDIIYDRIG